MSVFVINLIPNSLSGETSQDSEPNLAVNPANPLQIVATAFTPDPLSGTLAPIYISSDGGQTWALNFIVPGAGIAPAIGFYLPTADITPKFGGNSNVFYAGILRGDNTDLNILRTSNYASSTLMTTLVDRANEDQPWVQVLTAERASGSPDRVYIGNNDFNNTTTATVDFSLDAAAAAPPAGFAPHTITARVPAGGQNGPSIRPALHPDGTIYVGSFNWLTPAALPLTADVVISRDDNWGLGATPFNALLDPGDGLPGLRLAPSVKIPWANFAYLGQERVGSHLSVAVDPNNSSVVYIAWCDFPTGVAPYTIHVRRSSDRGKTWTADLRAVANGINPALAINVRSDVGFLYQTLTGGGTTWATQLEVTSDGFSTLPVPTVLCSAPSSVPAVTFQPYLGDYIYLTAVGKDFYGVFSANNTPNHANFPNGIVYQRNANFATNTLLNVDNVTPVPVSIDPFFFKITTVAAYDDFYVRDWTDSPSSGDTGLEPSNHAVFWATSDVWNRRGTLSGAPFPNDQPSNEDAGNGAGNLGDNWLFARIRRNQAAPSGSQTVTAHFLVSEFGTGSNFVDNLSGTPDITFDPGDPAVTFNPGDTGPLITAAFHWSLNATSSTHLCAAVEITGPNDPYIPPSLVGSAPGWPTTDLRVMNDNNKAQRNMGLTVTPARGVGSRPSYSALIHNAATFTRDMEVVVDATEENRRLLTGATLSIEGAKTTPFESGQKLVFSGMLPGEGRTLVVDFPCPTGKQGEIVTLDFHEMVGSTVVNGFSIGARLGSDQEVLLASAALHQSVFGRLDGLFQVPGAKDLASGVGQLSSKGAIADDDYVSFVKTNANSIQEAVARVPAGEKGDFFGVAAAAKALPDAAAQNDAAAIAIAHAAMLTKLDAWLTSLELAKGNVADILQNVRWQHDLYSQVARLRELPCAALVLAESSGFIMAYTTRNGGGKDFPPLIQKLMPCFQATAKAIGTLTQPLSDAVNAMKEASSSLASLQKAHRDFLLALTTLR